MQPTSNALEKGTQQSLLPLIVLPLGCYFSVVASSQHCRVLHWDLALPLPPFPYFARMTEQHVLQRNASG